ncbi:heme peroxidase [Xylaria grammica]|nr:heme peroxidase [Xylaria grammica]
MPRPRRHHHRLSLSLSLPLLAAQASAMFYYPNAQVSQLEHILVDNGGAYASNFSSAVTPCTRYVTEIGSAADNSGRTTSAQWLRVLFHDFVTADVAAGTGGVDASIGFETLRDENKGSAFNDSFTFWRPFVNEFVPMADLVALGAVMSVSLCGERNIPFRPGRVDALGAGPTGVPEPGTSLEETLGQFARSGFNQTDAIALTACGHTLGSAHHSGFPEVSDNSTVSAHNTNGGIDFDATRGSFDAAVVREYVDGTGGLGGPLVTSFNETSRSDLRLYESDGNATMRALYARGEAGFLDACVGLLGRVLDTVPAGVALRDVVRPMAVKPVNVTWDVGADGELVLSGRIRILTQAPNPKPSSATISFSNGHSTPLTFEPLTGHSVHGTAYYGSFTALHTSISNATSFRVLTAQIPPSTAPSSSSFAIQSTYAILPSQTTFSPSSSTINLTVAVRAGAATTDLSAHITAPVAQPLTLGPGLRAAEVELEKGGEGEEAGPSGYALWRGSVDLEEAPTGAVSVRLVRGGETLDTLLLDAGVAGW